MTTYSWDDLRVCLALGRHKTMSGAARALGSNTATVSRRVEKLSSQLGTQLFVREGQGWAPTPLATDLIALADEMETRLIDIFQSHDPAADYGQLNICADLAIIQTRVMPLFEQLIGAFPEVDFKVSMFPASLALGETDLALTFDMPGEGRLVRAKVRDEPLMLYHDRRHGITPKDWIRIELGPTKNVWTNRPERHFGHGPRFTVHGLNVAREAMERVPLACVLPVCFAERHPDLVADAGFGTVEVPVWICYHESRRHDQVLRKVTSWLLDQLRSDQPG